MKLTALLYRDIAPYKKLVDEFPIHLWSLGTRADSDADETRQRTGIQVGKTESNIGYQIRKKPLIFLPNGENHVLKNGKLQTANDTKTENPTFFSAKLKTEKPTYKIPKLNIPTPAPILSKEFL